MTLGEGKRRVLMLLDEYSLDGAPLADADLDARMNDLFDMAQRDVAAWQPIVRRRSLTLDGTGDAALPADVLRVLRIRRGGRRAADCEAVDGRLLFRRGDCSTVTLDYIAAAQRITPETPDDYAFEVSAEAANCLPFFVAAQQRVADLVVDYGAFYNMYLQMRALLPRAALPGAVRQTLYGG
ncbi:MAG: hypothetical protein K6G54_08740 [Oscillospiraceae bacterium]|nr:hypothetical protein [Oscillospiraceae bacterium]